jgi:phage-related protein
LQEYAYYSELVDVSIDTIGSSLGKMIKSMANAQSGTGEQAEAFEKLGVSILDANGNLRDSNDVFAETIDALGQIENETEADAIASEIFGRSFQDLNPLVAIGSEGMKELAEEAKKMGSNLSDYAIDTLQDLDDEYEKVNSTQTNLTNAIGALVAPMQVKVVAAVASMIGGMAASLNEGELLTGEFSESVKEGLTNLVQSITDNLPQFLDIGLKLVGNIVLGIGQSLPDIIPMLIDTILKMVEVILDNLPMFVEAGYQIITGLAMGIVNSIPVIVAVIPQLITSLINSIVGSIQAVVNAGIQLLTALIDALPTIIDAVVTAIL